ncbi:hypothetical protein ABPG72_002204 [Tetrahymena utriculariae]
MEEAQQQNIGTLQGIQDANEKNLANGSSSNLKIFSKTDLFNNLNTEMSEIPEHEIYSQEVYNKLIGGDEKFVQSQLNQIIQQALYPYQEKIRQLEEIQKQKDNQITALFYTIKKMDDIIKKIESEQTKTQGTTRSVRKTATTVQNNTIGASSNRPASSAKGQQLGSSQMSQSTVLPSQTGGVASRKPSVPSLLDSKKSGQSMSKSTLHEPSSNKADSNRNSKVSTPASRVTKEATEPKKVLKSKLGNNEGDQKINPQQDEQKQKKTENTELANIQNNLEVDSASNKQQSNQSNGKTDISSYNSSPPIFLHDLANDEHLIDSSSAKNGSDKDKNVLNNSSNINEDSMLL